MADDKDKAVLASRVLYYLKRKFGNGPQPSPEETKAAIAAVTLLSTAFQSEAKDPARLFEKLKQVARSENVGDFGAQSEMDQMRMQIYADRQAKVYELLSNILKKQGDTANKIAGNLR